jgi:hypothetical protein
MPANSARLMVCERGVEVTRILKRVSEAGARKVEVVVSIWRPRCSHICVGFQWPFLRLRLIPRRSNRHATQSRSCRATSLRSAKKKS